MRRPRIHRRKIGYPAPNTTALRRKQADPKRKDYNQEGTNE